MRTVRALISYDGRAYHGWQRQDGFYSVQEAIEEALYDLVGEKVTVHGSGRTDTGVHALGQVAHFHVHTALDDDRLRHALNHRLASRTVLQRLETCRGDFHARFDARGKRYAYVIWTSRFKPPLADGLVHWTRSVLDWGAMQRAADAFRGEHDFRAFSNAGSDRKTTVRRIQSLRLIARHNRIVLVVQGNGFLYNMVRTMVGTLLEVGTGRLPVDCVAQALRSGVRTDAGMTAPAAGLYLVRVLYPEPIFQGRDRGPGGVPGALQY